VDLEAIGSLYHRAVCRVLIVRAPTKFWWHAAAYPLDSRAQLNRAKHRLPHWGMNSEAHSDSSFGMNSEAHSHSIFGMNSGTIPGTNSESNSESYSGTNSQKNRFVRRAGWLKA
jgi:hypothetical protein